MSGSRKPARTTPRCPICGRPRDLAFRPFCSKRCRDVDLHRWFGGAYAIPVAEPGEEDDEAPGPPPRGPGGGGRT